MVAKTPSFSHREATIPGFLPSCRFRTNDKNRKFKRDEEGHFEICWADFDTFGLLSLRNQRVFTSFVEGSMTMPARGQRVFDPIKSSTSDTES